MLNPNINERPDLNQTLLMIGNQFEINAINIYQ
jgi:hypothetical protein